MINVSEHPEVSRPQPINLRSYHSQCEINYSLCMALMPGCRGEQSYWAFTLDAEPALEMRLTLVESAPYTSVVEITLVYGDSDSVRHLPAPRLRVRLYHDAEMAEVASWNRHRHWLPVYQYPNRHMYHRDEKIALNRFLGEWLVHCHKMGIACGKICESIRINKK